MHDVYLQQQNVCYIGPLVRWARRNTTLLPQKNSPQKQKPFGEQSSNIGDQFFLAHLVVITHIVQNGRHFVTTDLRRFLQRVVGCFVHLLARLVSEIIVGFEHLREEEEYLKLDIVYRPRC
jgi:hypothetical protein